MDIDMHNSWFFIFIFIFKPTQTFAIRKFSELFDTSFLAKYKNQNQNKSIKFNFNTILDL